MPHIQINKRLLVFQIDGCNNVAYIWENLSENNAFFNLVLGSYDKNSRSTNCNQKLCF